MREKVFCFYCQYFAIWSPLPPFCRSFCCLYTASLESPTEGLPLIAWVVERRASIGSVNCMGSRSCHHEHPTKASIELLRWLWKSDVIIVDTKALKSHVIACIWQHFQMALLKFGKVILVRQLISSLGCSPRSFYLLGETALLARLQCSGKLEHIIPMAIQVSELLLTTMQNESEYHTNV